MTTPKKVKTAGKAATPEVKKTAPPPAPPKKELPKKVEAVHPPAEMEAKEAKASFNLSFYPAGKAGEYIGKLKRLGLDEETMVIKGLDLEAIRRFILRYIPMNEPVVEPEPVRVETDVSLARETALPKPVSTAAKPAKKAEKGEQTATLTLPTVKHLPPHHETVLTFQGGRATKIIHNEGPMLVRLHTHERLLWEELVVHFKPLERTPAPRTFTKALQPHGAPEMNIPENEIDKGLYVLVVSAKGLVKPGEGINHATGETLIEVI